jgi:hypothetical protein
LNVPATSSLTEELFPGNRRLAELPSGFVLTLAEQADFAVLVSDAPLAFASSVRRQTFAFHWRGKKRKKKGQMKHEQGSYSSGHSMNGHSHGLARKLN